MLKRKFFSFNPRFRNRKEEELNQEALGEELDIVEYIAGGGKYESVGIVSLEDIIRLIQVYRPCRNKKQIEKALKEVLG